MTISTNIRDSDDQSSAIIEYIHQHAKSPHGYLSQIRAHCLEHKWNFMLTTPDQAAFLYSQAKLLKAQKILEIGCFYGHSTLALASALEENGKLISIEHNPKFVKIASEHMQNAGVAKQVDFLVGEAPHCIQEIRNTHPTGSFDLVFIDADKKNIENYWNQALELIRKGGIIIIDNALARGEIVKENSSEASYITAIRAFHEKCQNDKRIFSYIATLGDGMHVTLKL